MHYPLIDLDLSRRLEDAEGAANARFIEARAVVDPARGASWLKVGGTSALFDGVGSPLTQTFALGLHEAADDPTVGELERFFTERGAAVEHEVSPMALGDPLTLLASRGYRPVELTSVMFRPIDEVDLEFGHDASISVQPLPGAGDGPAWANAAADGWAEHPEIVPFVREIGAVYTRTVNATCFVAEVDGTIAATGVLATHGGVAVLAGASTRPAWRRRGAQTALLRARLRHAASTGCDLAMMCARPGSASQRNAERRGFRVAYTRLKWRLDRVSNEMSI